MQRSQSSKGNVYLRKNGFEDKEAAEFTQSETVLYLLCQYSFLLLLQPDVSYGKRGIKTDSNKNGFAHVIHISELHFSFFLVLYRHFSFISLTDVRVYYHIPEQHRFPLHASSKSQLVEVLQCLCLYKYNVYYFKKEHLFVFRRLMIFNNHTKRKYIIHCNHYDGSGYQQVYVYPW